MNLGFQVGKGNSPGNSKRTTHILYSNLLGEENVGHLDAIITPKGGLNVLKSGSVNDGIIISDKASSAVSDYWKCVASWAVGGCAGTAVLCIASNSGYLACLGIGCLASGVAGLAGCVVSELMLTDPTPINCN